MQGWLIVPRVLYKSPKGKILPPCICFLGIIDRHGFQPTYPVNPVMGYFLQAAKNKHA